MLSQHRLNDEPVLLAKLNNNFNNIALESSVA